MGRKSDNVEKNLLDVISLDRAIVYLRNPTYTPTLLKLLINKNKLKNSVIYQGVSFFDMIEKYFEDFDLFVSINYKLSKFEEELIRQLIKANKKKDSLICQMTNIKFL